eukprot:2856059-Amphidinium_carterae.1
MSLIAALHDDIIATSWSVLVTQMATNSCMTCCMQAVHFQDTLPCHLFCVSDKLLKLAYGRRPCGVGLETKDLPPPLSPLPNPK